MERGLSPGWRLLRILHLWLRAVPADPREPQEHLLQLRPASVGGLFLEERLPKRTRGYGVSARPNLALQLLFLRASESMGNHDSNVVGAGRVG